MTDNADERECCPRRLGIRETPLTPEQEAERYGRRMYPHESGPMLAASRDYLAGYRSRDAEVTALRNALQNAKRRHDECDDSWYSCPKTGRCSNSDDNARGECTCGADRHNAAIDAVLSANDWVSVE